MRGVTPIGLQRLRSRGLRSRSAGRRRPAVIAALAEFNRHTAKTHSGIWRDLAVRKRRTEVDPQIGVIASLGAEVGVATPAIVKLVELIHAIEDGTKLMAFETFQELIDTCAST